MLAASRLVIAARSGSAGSKKGSGWTTRMSVDWRHSRGVRFSVQTTIEMSSRTRLELNHHELKTLKTWSRSRKLTTADPMSAS